MPNFTVEVQWIESEWVQVEADNVAEAEERALEEFWGYRNAEVTYVEEEDE